MSSRLGSLIAPAAFTALMGALLVGLGLWQLQRLTWKTAIVARIEARAQAPTQPLPPPSSWPGLRPDDYEYRRVTLRGRYDHEREALVFRGTAAGPGFFVLTPLRLTEGGTVIVNRGFVPTNRADPASRRDGQAPGVVAVTGLMRPPESRNPFTPTDDPATGRYFTRDPALIARHFALAEAAPFSVDADATAVPGGWPRGGTTEVATPNNHLSYALTWFGLAAGLLAVFATLAWRRLRTEPEQAASPARLPV